MDYWVIPLDGSGLTMNTSLDTLIDKSVEEQSLSTTNMQQKSDTKREVLYKRPQDREFRRGKLENRKGFKIVYVGKEFFQERATK